MLRRAAKGSGVTTLHVTHSREDAMKLGDRVLRLDGEVKGIVEQESR